MRGRPRYALPESMDDIVDAIGVSASLSLVQIYAGTKIYLPKADRITERHPVAALLGLPLAVRLCVAKGGEAVTIPVCYRMLADRREDEILRRLEEGATITELATAYALSERAIYAMKARTRA